MIIIQDKYPLRTNIATTSDWIEQIEGGVIYAYDLGAQYSGSIRVTDRSDNQNMVHETVQKYKSRFKEAWEELSDR